MAAEDDEDFVSFGSALEPLEDESTKKAVPLQEQTVKDEKGRYKRFHGAFTGGFSAGFFNSVGTKEGWAPSTFISSRQQKADKQLFGPEQFMDEEDLKEHGIAPKGITTTDDFASKAKDKIREKSRALASVAAPIPGATILDDMISPAKITIGVQLLRKMGWKEGQGLGPRVKRRPRRQQCGTGVKVYGCSLPDEGLDGSEEEEDEYQPENVTFAPKDVMMMDFTPKDDRHGLGYSGIDPSRALYGVAREESITMFNTDSDRSSSLLGDVQSGKGRKLGITGQAFGVGALEEEDDDIYARDTLSQYDTVLREEEPDDGLYGWTAPQQYKKKAKGLEPQVGYIGKVLEGFSLRSKSTEPKKVYGPPELPRDYRPVHYFRPVVAPGTVSVAMAQALGASEGQLSTEVGPKGRHQLNATQRRELLGEDALQGPRSVFELLSGKDKERLKDVQQQQAATPASWDLSSRTQALTSEGPRALQLAAVSGGRATGSSEFKPFLKNPEKQKRYEEYVAKLQLGQSNALDSSLDPNMTEWERDREQYEFSRAATLYRPSSASLASRFTSAKFSEDTDKVEVPEQQEAETNDKESAVKMKMFGSLTRDKLEWHPEKLLCKRFNIPDPYPGSTKSGLLKVKRDKYSVFNFLTVPTAPAPSVKETKRESAQHDRALKSPESRRRSRWDMSAEDKEKDIVHHAANTAAETSLIRHTEKVVEQDRENSPSEKVDAEEEESRPSMDLFKAIFASSSEENSSSSSSDEAEEVEDEEPSEMDPLPGMQGAGTSVPWIPPAVCQPGIPPAVCQPGIPPAVCQPGIPPAVCQPGIPPAVCQPGIPLTVCQPVKESDGNPETAQCSAQTPTDKEEFGPRLPPALLFGNTKTSADYTTRSPVPECKRSEECHSTSQQKDRLKKKHKERQKGKKAKKEKKKKHKKHKHRSKPKSRNLKESDSSSGESEALEGSGRIDGGKYPHSVSPADLLKR
ncbi:G patch domain-containing protein 1 isoform X2 [Scyliorhinus canicula]|uniref:G patch domain-containing protein 1 isoform X2 n=1 Tax=Scyliorhinus canicula TaxID=7830 RepID=UPI0018F3FA91|nr:G patch domain-containing protein 1 isoform X2 [Scyliorhinus canicula]